MIVERTCIVCRKKSEKSNFIKIVFNKKNEIKIVKDKYLQGRGAYICKTNECLNKCLKTKALNRAFKSPIPQEFYDELLETFKSE